MTTSMKQNISTIHHDTSVETQSVWEKVYVVIDPPKSIFVTLRRVANAVMLCSNSPGIIPGMVVKSQVSLQAFCSN